MASDEIKKVLTENPLIDEIVYECQQIIKGIILKDEQHADLNETALSLKYADIYHDIQMGTDRFEYYEYTYDIFMQIPSMDPSRALRYARGQEPIPEGLKPELQRLAREKWLSEYEEQNEYYRRLAGLPPLGFNYIYLSDEEYQMIPVESYDISKPVHKCTVAEADLLYNSGVIDALKEKYPARKYLDHLGERSIDPYLARRTAKFGLLYMPPVNSPEVANKWRERFEINRVYVLTTLYSEAYKFHSAYYDRFMMMMIIIMTFEDMITYSPEYIIERNLFDLRTIEYIFNACGVEFFPEIPLKYQKRLVKNLNRLIKYKSSAKCMVDIVSLFGFENMELFKYYIMKTPIVNEDGSYRKDTITDPVSGKEVLDLEANYKLQFLKVPLDGIADDYIDDPFNYVDYETTANNDIWWNGVYTKEYVKRQILQREFSIHKSKYISVDSVYSLTEMQFQMVYFINMLLYGDVNTDMLMVDVPEISSNVQFKLTDLLITLYSLSYLYYETRDNIVYDPVQAMDVKGFNFDADIHKLISYIEEKGYDPKDIGLDLFTNPNPIGIRSWEQLESVYDNNSAFYKKLIELMKDANDYEEYKLYRTVYESLYVTKLNFDMFKVDSLSRPPKTYQEYLLHANIRLYNLIRDCELVPKDTDRQLEITRCINFIVEDIYCYLDQDKFKYIFNGIPTVGLDYVRNYIFKILNFFKSYKVDVIHTNMIYKFDDQLENRVWVWDQIFFHYIFTKTDKIPVSDCFKLLDSFNWKEDFALMEKMYMDITYWKERRFYDKSPVDDKDHWREILVHINYSDLINPTDKIGSHNSVFTWGQHMNAVDDMKTVSIINPYTTIGMKESLHFERHYPKKTVSMIDSATYNELDLVLYSVDGRYEDILLRYNTNASGWKVPTNITAKIVFNGIECHPVLRYEETETDGDARYYKFRLSGAPESGELYVYLQYKSFSEYDPQIIVIPFNL